MKIVHCDFFFFLETANIYIRKRALSTRSAQEKTLTEPYKNSPRARVEINKPLPQAPGEQNRTEKRKIQEGYTRKTETKQQHYFLLIHNIGSEIHS
jgi:hypothetical protein